MDAEWPGMTDDYGHGVSMREMRYAQGVLAVPPQEGEGSWDWHPVAIEKRSHCNYVLSAAPGDVCVRCFKVWDGAGVSEFAGW